MNTKKIAVWAGITAGVTALVGVGYYMLSNQGDDLHYLPAPDEEAPAGEAVEVVDSSLDQPAV